MDNHEALKILTEHNQWRRGDEGIWHNPTEVGEAIDTAISVLSSLPAPTQDGTAEEFMDQWSNHNSWRSKGGIHKMITAYAAPLRAEIERLKSELAASVSPKLVMPERKEFNRFGDHLDDMHVQTWNMVLDELRRLNPSILK